MIRYNYQPSAFERFSAHVPIVTLDAARRRMLLWSGAILGALGILTAVELSRLGTVEDQLAALHARAAAGAQAETAVVRLTAEVARLHSTSEAIERTRRDALLRANDLVRIGNLLPAQTWLTAVREDRAGTWSIEGRSTRLIEIGATLGALQRVDPHAAVRLLSVLGIGHGRGIQFVLTWERRS